ncbi:hypothetical protein CAEBREN_06939 [Caenorhabditis brenneri]|uniref:Serpin domain-containing protein n=1 Tax=Caenorhabditis brenneri TaxID=135651 RepID=G0NFG7_CAEBE|nr:hypothetical protein CAEBREN_06939 [Caenorhabditis brenneri]
MTSHDGLEATFGFNVLDAIGVQEPYQFSPISLLFTLALLGKDGFNSTISKEYSKIGMEDLEVKRYLKNDLGDLVVRADSGVNDVRRNTPNETRIYFDLAWETKLVQKRAGKFYPTPTSEKNIIYLKNEKRVLLKVDDVFQMISIRYDNKNLEFVVLLPVKLFDLKNSLKKLTKARFDNLFRGASLEMVHVMIPKFDILQLYMNSKKLGLQPPINTSVKYKQPPRPSKTFVYRPENREPYFFKADHPFVFGILRKGRPVYLGIYS